MADKYAGYSAQEIQRSESLTVVGWPRLLDSGLLDLFTAHTLLKGTEGVNRRVFKVIEAYRKTFKVLLEILWGRCKNKSVAVFLMFLV